MERKIFRGVGAVIATVATDHRFTVVGRMRGIDATDFSADRRIEIDLNATPSRAASWSNVLLDDRGIDSRGNFLGSAMSPSQLTGFHVTSLGGYVGSEAPEDLSRGPFVGAVYLEDAYFRQNRAKLDPPEDPWPTSGLRTYQLTTIAYSDNPANETYRKRRYAGFHGRLKQWKAGAIASVELIDTTGAAIGTWDFDLGNSEHCDPDPPVAHGESALRPTSAVNDEGAVFVELHRVAEIVGTGPKLPIGLGG
jgi:subtilisin family serine protease